MAKTFSDLQVGTRVYLDEASAADFLDTQVKRSINYAYHQVITGIIGVYQGYRETTTPFTYAVVANQQEYLIDSTIIKPTRVEINYSPQKSGSVPLRAIPIKMEEALLNISNSATSGSVFNAGYYIHGDIGLQYIGFIPIPQQGDLAGKSISVWGYTLPTDLVNSTDQPLIPYVDAWGYLIELKAAQILMSKGQENETVAAQYSNMYEQGLSKYIQFLYERQADGVNMITDSELDNLDFQTNPPF
jgi:hypothetical protein